jgi:rubredoxin
MKKYKCLMCVYIYDPDVGGRKNGAESGTALNDLPHYWVCPDCSASKAHFDLV